jgi:hypothetical protein
MSGKGIKLPATVSGTQADNINFFDPTRKEFTPNAVYDAFKRAFTPMPSIKSTLTPEVIVTVAKEANSIPVLAIRKGDSTLVGILPDPGNKAWFVLPSAGGYIFTHNNRTVVWDAKEKPSTQPPGFGCIDQLDLSSK